MNLSERCKNIRAVVLDVDGVLTNGIIGYGCGYDEEIKFFHVRDGHGIVMAHRAGLMVGVLSGRGSAANRRRAAELALDFVYEGELDKLAGFERLLEEQHLNPEEVMYIGDDVVDIPPFNRAGLAVCVGDAPDYLDNYTHFRTAADGGRGAVREAIELVLREQGKWDKLMERYER
ncbi:MAG: KdsC family phosphatase [Victivallaceae bacterium]|nr:HAD hydrolase family protein [Victivallaceae bacterium]